MLNFLGGLWSAVTDAFAERILTVLLSLLGTLGMYLKSARSETRNFWLGASLGIAFVVIVICLTSWVKVAAGLLVLSILLGTIVRTIFLYVVRERQRLRAHGKGLIEHSDDCERAQVKLFKVMDQVQAENVRLRATALTYTQKFQEAKDPSKTRAERRRVIKSAARELRQSSDNLGRLADRQKEHTRQFLDSLTGLHETGDEGFTEASLNSLKERCSVYAETIERQRSTIAALPPLSSEFMAARNELVENLKLLMASMEMSVEFCDALVARIKQPSLPLGS